MPVLDAIVPRHARLLGVGQAAGDIAGLAHSHVRVGIRRPGGAHFVVVHHDFVETDQVVPVLGHERRAHVAYCLEVLDRRTGSNFSQLVDKK